jgi:hypothetical protein
MAHDARAPPALDPARSRLADALDAIHDDYSRVHAERNALRHELARVTSLGELLAPSRPPHPPLTTHASQRTGL